MGSERSEPVCATKPLKHFGNPRGFLSSPYLAWDYSAPETAVMGVAIHAFEWGFVRLAPFVLVAALVGVFLTGKKHRTWFGSVHR